MYALLERDEELDSGVYGAYLRAQSDADLLDILQHLDPERYPFRVDAVRRETQRRHVLPVTVYSLEERFIRGLCVMGLIYAVAVLLLTLLLTQTDAAGPRWLSLDAVPAGTSAAELMRCTVLGFLRAIVVDGAQMGVPPLLWLILAGWLLYRALKRSIRREVKWDALAILVIFIAVFCLAAAPFSHVVELAGLSDGANGFGARLTTLLAPWGNGS
jgi:hypothetical protein